VAGFVAAVCDRRGWDWATFGGHRRAAKAMGAGFRETTLSPLSFGVFFFDSLAEPDLDDGLSRDANEAGLTIESLDHPSW